jgi:hypothetical protein
VTALALDPPAVARSRARLAVRVSVAALLVYYWAHLYLRALLPDSLESRATYWLLVGPVAVVASLSLARHALGGGRRYGLLGVGPLVLFTALAAVASLPRADSATLLSAGLFVIALMWLCAAPTRLPLGLVNGLFLASVATGIVFHLAGWSDYGWWPGQYVDGLDSGLGFRVSLFPLVPESAFFALVVVLCNQVAGRGTARWFWVAAGLYYLVFSGLRTALIAFVLCEAYLWATANHRRLSPWQRVALLVLALAVFIVVVAGSDVVLLVPGLAESPLGSYLLRSAADDLSAESLAQSVYRSWLWAQHLSIFASSPLTGIGTYEFMSVATEALIEDHDGTGSESFVTAWLSRVGLCFVPALVFFGRLFRRAAGAPDALEATLCIVLGVAAFGYGSFIVPYNFLFLLVLALLLARPRLAPSR